MRSWLPLPVLGVVLLALFACGDSPTEPGVVGSVEVEGPTTLVAGEEAQATATVLDQGGTPLPDAEVAWTSSDEQVATVDGGGFMVATGVGSATITATAGGVSGLLEVEVLEDPCGIFVGEVELGETVSGELTTESCLLEDWYHDAWRLELGSGVTVQIDLMSAEFSAFLILTDQQGNQIASDDDSGDGDDSRLVGELAAGVYVLWASTADDRDVGHYELSVVEADPIP